MHSSESDSNQQSYHRCGQATEQQRKATEFLLIISFALACMANSATSAARADFVLSFSGGDAGAASRLMGLMASSTSVLEFCFGPCLGRMSDRFGRLAFILLGPLGLLVCDGLVSLAPVKWVVIVGQVIKGMTLTSFVTILRGSLSDVRQGQALAMANSRMVIRTNDLGLGAWGDDLTKHPYVQAMYSGASIIIGPLFTARLLSNLRLHYGFSAILAAVNIAMLLTKYKETLPQS